MTQIDASDMAAKAVAAFHSAVRPERAFVQRLRDHAGLLRKMDAACAGTSTSEPTAKLLEAAAAYIAKSIGDKP